MIVITGCTPKSSDSVKTSKMIVSSSPLNNTGWIPYANRYAVIVMGGPAHNQQQYGYYWMDTYGMYQELCNLGFIDDNIYFISWGDSAVEHPEVVDRISCSLSINIPNGQMYRNDGDFIVTSFSLSQPTTAYSVAMNCLDDNDSDSSNETFECAITSDAGGNNVLTSAQVTANFKSEGGCAGHRYVFNFSDRTLNANTTYYLRTKVISGAPVRAWAGANLYHQSCLICDCNSSTDNSWTGCMKTDIQWAFGQIRSRSTQDDLVYVFWVDHGEKPSPGLFYLPGDNMTHSELNNCIKDIKAKILIGAYNPCYSGAVINDISRPGLISITSVNDSQPNAYGWAGQWRQALNGGTSSDPSDTNGDGYISMTEAYEWVAPKSQAYSRPEHPWFDDNGDDIGSEYGVAGYDPGDPGKDGQVGSMYSLTHFRSTPIEPTGNGYGESLWAGTAEKIRIIDLKTNFVAGTRILIRWTPGSAEKVQGTTTFSVATSSNGPWVSIGSNNDTTYRSPPTSSYWITYMKVFETAQSFRYVKVEGTNFIDYASAEAVNLQVTKESSSTDQKTRILDLGTTYQPDRKRILAIWFKPGWSSNCTGNATFSISTNSNGPWTTLADKPYKTHDNPSGSNSWINYGFLFVPTSTFRYIKVDIPNCFNDFTKVNVFNTTAVHPFGSQPPTP